jgi:VWFA-related protein
MLSAGVTRRCRFPRPGRKGGCPLFLAALTLALAPQQPAQFRSAVERIVIDVQIVDKAGTPLESLTAEDFEVRFDQKPRTIAAVQFIRAAAIDTPAAGAPVASGVSASTANAENRGSRDFILAVDESSFRALDAPAVMRAARAFVQRLAPNDRVGLFTYPASPRIFPLTPDHTSVSLELARVMGTLVPPQSHFHLSPSEVIDIEAGDTDLVRNIARRECLPQPIYQGECMKAIPGDANLIAQAYESLSATSVKSLRLLLAALDQAPTRKTVVVISGGLLASDRVGGRPDISGIVDMVAVEAGRVRANLYVLHVDSSFLQSFSVTSGGGGARTADGVARSSMRESSALGAGLDRLAGATGGTLVRVEPGGEQRAFDRILRETSAYYLLAVEPTDADRDGRMHSITVKVNARGVEVRARRTVIIPKAQIPTPILP